MGPYKVKLQPSALLDLQQARTYYRGLSLGLVRKLNAEIEAAVMQISRAPFAYSIRFDSNRRYNLKNFPFAIFYLADEASQTIHLTAFIHISRNYPASSEDPNTIHEP